MWLEVDILDILRYFVSTVFFSFIELLVFDQHMLFRADFLCVTLELMTQGGDRGQNIGHLYSYVLFC